MAVDEQDVYGVRGVETAHNVVMLTLLLALTVYHLYHVRTHVPNKTKTFGAVTEPSITETQASGASTQSASGSHGGGTGSTRLLLCDGKFRVTPDATSAGYMLCSLLVMCVNVALPYAPFNESSSACNAIMKTATSFGFVGEGCALSFLMLRVRINMSEYSKLQRTVANVLWVWLVLGTVVGVAFSAAGDTGTIVPNADYGARCDPSEDEVFQLGFAVWALMSFSVQLLALALFVWPMWKWVQRHKSGQGLSASAQQVFKFVKKIAIWSTVMVSSTMLAYLVFALSGLDILFPANYVLNAYAILQQYLRRDDDGVLEWYLKCGACNRGESATEDDVAGALNVGGSVAVSMSPTTP